MCGRFVSTSSPATLAAVFDASPPDVELPSRYNVAPTMAVYGIVQPVDGGRRIEVFRWGLVPSWAKDISIGSRLINARAETAAEKPAFRASFARRRVIVPMDGFYEWQPPAVPKGPKQPYFVHRADDLPIAAAGLWSTWRDPSVADESAAWLHSCTLLTTAANSVMSPVHDRMPVVLEPADWDEWLDPANADTDDLAGLLRPAAPEVLVLHPVSTAVNRVGTDSPALIAAVGEAIEHEATERGCDGT
ncbi:MAG: SOS response-associated peptidase [Ilumatobacteraceae bacterium]